MPVPGRSGKQGHGKRIPWVAEQQHEPLSSATSMRVERRTGHAEVRQTARPVGAAELAARHHQRPNYEAASTNVTAIAISVIRALGAIAEEHAAAESGLKPIVNLGGVEKERAVVGGRRDVVVIAG